jgi:hypothetical protein
LLSLSLSPFENYPQTVLFFSRCDRNPVQLGERQLSEIGFLAANSSVLFNKLMKSAKFSHQTPASGKVGRLDIN